MDVGGTPADAVYQLLEAKTQQANEQANKLQKMREVFMEIDEYLSGGDGARCINAGSLYHAMIQEALNDE